MIFLSGNDLPAHRMCAIQSALFKAQSHPVIGVIPAVLKCIVSAIELIAAGTFMLFLQTAGKHVFSSRYVAHELDACQAHIGVGSLSLYQGIIAILFLGTAGGDS